MSEAEVGAYCRQKGLYPEQVQRWKKAFLQGTSMQEGADKRTQKQQRDSRKTIKKLQAEIRRKDRVLAETTSLLVLSKKLEALYGEDPDSEDN
jgi:transposase-like protein